MTDTTIDPTQPDLAPPPTAPPVAPAAPADPATQPAEEPDYKSLYEKTLTDSRKWESRAKENREKAKRLDQIEDAQRTDVEKATTRADAAEQQLGQMRRRAVDAEIRAAAASWADPTDAPRYLDDRDKYLGEHGEIDTAAITADLAAVLAARPHLARAEGPRPPAPDPGQGARPVAGTGLGAQITEAEQAGDWRTSLRLKANQAIELSRQQHTTP